MSSLNDRLGRLGRPAPNCAEKFRARREPPSQPIGQNTQVDRDATTCAGDGGQGRKDQNGHGPDWPDLVAAVTDQTAATGLPAANLLDQALAGLDTANPADGGLPADAVPAMLIARLGEHTAEPAHGGDEHDLPPDPADVDTTWPDDLDELHPLTEQPPASDPGRLSPIDTDLGVTGQDVGDTRR